MDFDKLLIVLKAYELGKIDRIKKSDIREIALSVSVLSRLISEFKTYTGDVLLSEDKKWVFDFVLGLIEDFMKENSEVE
jgi:hypothetical protein